MDHSGCRCSGGALNCAVCDVDFNAYPSHFEVEVMTIVYGGIDEHPRSRGYVYRDFWIPGDVGRAVGAQITGEVAWKGIISSAIGLDASSELEIRVILVDVTTDQVIGSQLVHENGCSEYVSKLCGAVDEGTAPISIPTTLIRGHSYQLRLQAAAKADVGFGIGFDVSCIYRGSESGIWANYFELTVEPDLVERIDALEAMIVQLQEQLSQHTHGYLTGRGTGHNDTEAVTTPAYVDDMEPPSEGSSFIGLGRSQEPEDRTSLPGSSSEALGLLNVSNQQASEFQIRFRVDDSAAPLQIDIYDVAGRRVRSLADGTRSPGEHTVVWNGRDDAGNRAATGVYFVRYETTSPNTASSRKVVLIN